MVGGGCFPFPYPSLSWGSRRKRFRVTGPAGASRRRRRGPRRQRRRTWCANVAGGPDRDRLPGIRTACCPRHRARSPRCFMPSDRSLFGHDLQIPCLRRNLYARRCVRRRCAASCGAAPTCGASVRRANGVRRRACPRPPRTVGGVSDVADVEQAVVRGCGRGIGNDRGDGGAPGLRTGRPAGESTLDFGPGSGAHRPRGSPRCRATTIRQSANRTINYRDHAQPV